MEFRSQQSTSALEIRENQRRVFCKGREIPLTKTEYEILLYLFQNINQVLTHDQIYEKIWKEPDYGEARKLVSHHVQSIRRKLNLGKIPVSVCAVSVMSDTALKQNKASSLFFAGCWFFHIYNNPLLLPCVTFL